MPGKLPILDRKIFGALCDNVGEAAAARLTESLKAEIRVNGKKMCAFADSADMGSLETLAHGLKSAVRSFGALKLGGVCALLEENARSEQDAGQIGKQLVLFKAAAADTIAALEKRE